MSRIAVLIVAAGKGVRAGTELPKQYERLGGMPMLRRTVQAFRGLAVQVVIGPGQETLAAEALSGLDVSAPVPGGATRQESVRLGLEALAKDAPDFVLIHDAARPLISRKVTDDVVEALQSGADGALPMVAASDTLRRRDVDGRWTLVSRDNLYRAQTPQGFVYDKILRAHRDHAKEDVTDDVALAELAGLKVEMVEGEEKNIKVTRKEDFALAETLLGVGDVRTASGYDVHKFTDGDHIMLCGLKIPHSHALEGHSDADVGLHAITDALLGCIGEGDIGQHFPPTDERWRGAPSWKFLDHAASLVAAKGGVINNVDLTIICERPKVGPHRDAMKAKIAEILKIASDRVSVKATTTEGLGFTGRREGIAAQATATVRL
ncbi:MAG TPA: bifunctional 2-C-methyl-D-erythritol 4-phosphate cytidylyltransferase/2-C-methyl-D-erythritol 2,4-cyclodiphosphate synthase [Rhizomicrobium sp.]|jgi:2-C-methyl-D-erythritol 4-phosphate cytidylyltransferase/2-C-methyl-D-erythritol 2,4-cyclodiphosphate synthase|nr:bifunctional 2-C-methyl-D-erythritol 4-phosphate cytidylyltransferase/2-C-methyl-D-erythritol 2,4-cyclodiphosphate synthase [Rhizomicrobium sp.]